ncbi:MAG: formylglycine-generating enzyme family protein [Chloroflexi bacterium]|nr:formylglycine-generating enzyme family protein [Chloroflexota bacterium]
MNAFNKLLRNKNVKLALGAIVVLGIIVIGVGMGGTNALTGAGGLAASEPTQTPSVTPEAPVESAPEEPSPTPTDTATAAPTATITPTPPPGIGSTTVSEIDGATLVYVPGGDFLMGSTGTHPDEQPQHIVSLDSFWIDQFEVTNTLYAQCVNAGSCEPPENVERFNDPTLANYAVVDVSWYNAGAYCAWAGRRLPTEAEWEKAARGTDGRLFPWGNALPASELLNFRNEFGAVEVGSYPNGVSPYGAHDMAGNVWEWVNDRYGETYYRTSPSVNPQGPEDGQDRVLRGGAWYSVTDNVRVTYRSWVHPTTRNYYFGFRCARAEFP